MFIRIFCLLLPFTASASEVSLIDFLDSAWRQGPAIKAEAKQNDSSEQFISSARGKYLPHVSLDAIDSTGFPASNGELQVNGLMASPFRSGFAGGVVVEETVYDFGRITAALQSARAERSLNQARLADEKFRFLLTAGQIYLSCAHARSMRELDQELMKWAQINLRETARFTQTGQRSIVDNSLVQTEVNNLNLELTQIDLYQKSLIQQMQLFGVKQDCQGLKSAIDLKVGPELQVDEPSVLLAKAQIESAQAGVESAKASQLPSLKVMGSVGYMDDSRLVDQRDYAAGVGFTFPVWNGGEDLHREQAYKAQTDYQKENLKTAELEYNARIKNLQDQFDRQKIALTQLEADLETVEKTIRLATKRYHTLQGPLIDVREAFKQLRDMGGQHLRVEQSLASVSLQLGILRRKKD